MTIGIMSDSHDNMPKIAAAVKCFAEAGVEHVVHAGDFVAPFVFRELRHLSCPLTGVFGNNDGERFGLHRLCEPVGVIHPRLAVVELSSKRIAVVHEPDFVADLAASGRHDVVVYGHTHEHDIRTGGTLIINPGEVCGYLTGRSTVVLLALESGQFDTVEL